MRETAIIRHNAWNGYTAYHKCNTQEHGSCYIGDGLKNNNICFELWTFYIYKSILNKAQSDDFS